MLPFLSLFGSLRCGICDTTMSSMKKTGRAVTFSRLPSRVAAEHFIFFIRRRAWIMWRLITFQAATSSSCKFPDDVTITSLTARRLPRFPVNETYFLSDWIFSLHRCFFFIDIKVNWYYYFFNGFLFPYIFFRLNCDDTRRRKRMKTTFLGICDFFVDVLVNQNPLFPLAASRSIASAVRCRHRSRRWGRNWNVRARGHSNDANATPLSIAIDRKCFLFKQQIDKI